MTKPLLTPQGKTRLEATLAHLKFDRLEQTRAVLEQARSEGDITDNFGFEGALQEMLGVQHRIATLEEQLAEAEVITIQPTEQVQLGAFVALEADGEVFEFQLVDPSEANWLEGRVSVDSPVGQAVLGRREGEGFLVGVPKGELFFRVRSLGFGAEQKDAEPSKMPQPIASQTTSALLSPTACQVAETRAVYTTGAQTMDT